MFLFDSRIFLNFIRKIFYFHFLQKKKLICFSRKKLFQSLETAKYLKRKIQFEKKKVIKIN